jgi:signal transduction histidine kinase
VDGDLLRTIKTSIGFTNQDAANLRQLGPLVRPAVPGIVDAFYHTISRHAATRDILAGDHAVEGRLRQSLELWINSLFSGTYDQAYANRRAVIGAAHLRVGLPQHAMFVGMEIMWQQIADLIRNSQVPQHEAQLASLHKILTIDFALILEAYKQSYSDQVRESERSLVRDKLTRAEHLAEIGSLAASIAHEVKNPLAGISGAIQVIRKGLQPDDPRRPIITEVLGQIDRLDSAVKDLLLYARPNPPRILKCDLNAIIERVLKVLRAEPDMRSIVVDFQPDPQLPPLPADEAQIEQVLINLLLNAAQASNDGDTIHLSVGVNNSSLRLVLRDHGHGMEDLVRDRMFEPFFTTKAKGTGLGLSICRRVVEAHRGRISVETQLGEGTTVTVDLPVTPPA